MWGRRPNNPDISPEEKALFGERIRDLRERSGMTQEELARRARISRQHMNQIENGRQLPGLRPAGRIARALGTTLKNLGGGIQF
jgi:transcriptional regulator with XRE-family HTH domain